MSEFVLVGTGDMVRYGNGKGTQKSGEVSFTSQQLHLTLDRVRHVGKGKEDVGYNAI